MNHPIAQHDQMLAYLRNDSLRIHVDGASSFEIIAREFEGYWRTLIGHEVKAKHFPHDIDVPNPILITIWGLDNDGFTGTAR